MSVIVRDQAQDIWIYTKGADNIIIALLERENSRYVNETLQNLGVFGNEGLRTLVYARRQIPHDEFQVWNEKYKQASYAIVDREEQMEALQAEIETKLVLLGATGIEDKLQDQVGETISFLVKAGIKVWMLTGDKVETARSIGRSCQLVHNGMIEIKVDGITEEEVMQQLVDAVDKSELPHQAGYYLIITGDALKSLPRPEMTPEVQLLFNRIQTVIASRVSPKQKQEIVEIVRRTVDNFTFWVKSQNPCISLSIGDGANDVNMINAADVGIGIKGKEGLQAARASDFAIGEFKHLKRLLFVHGRESYRKNTTAIRYNFFKNMVLVIPQFWYGFLDVFSGQSLYHPILYMFFNLLYATLPIILYATLDEEYPDHILEKYPIHYNLGKQNKIFRAWSFWRWVISGVLQAIPLSIFVYYPHNLFNPSFYIMCYSAITTNGLTADFWMGGMLTYTLVVFIANFKILIVAYKNALITIVAIVGSILIYFVTVGILNIVKDQTGFEVISNSLQSPNWYLGLILGLCSTVLFDLGFERLTYLKRYDELAEISDAKDQKDIRLKSGAWVSPDILFAHTMDTDNRS